MRTNPGGYPESAWQAAAPPTHSRYTQNPTSRQGLEGEHRLERKVVRAIVQLEPAACRALQAALNDLGHPAVHSSTACGHGTCTSLAVAEFDVPGSSCLSLCVECLSWRHRDGE